MEGIYRIDQTEHSPINPLNLDLRSDRHDYTPNTIAENEWSFVNPELDDPPTSEDIAITRSQWESFLESFDTPEELEEQSWSEDQMDTIVDKKQFLYTMADYDFTPDTYEESMNDFIEEAGLDEFERFLPTAISHEDIHDLTSRVDDGSDAENIPKWVRALE